jgi:hypothetical protein
MILRYYNNTGLKEWEEPKNPVSMHLGSDSKMTPSQHEIEELTAMGRSGSMQK